MTRIDLGGAVVDRDLRILAWNRKSEDFWGHRTDEVYLQNFITLDIGLPVEQLKRPLLDILNGNHDGSTFDLQAINRRGKTIICQVSFNPLAARDKSIQGVIILMEDEGSVPVTKDIQGYMDADL